MMFDKMQTVSTSHSELIENYQSEMILYIPSHVCNGALYSLPATEARPCLLNDWTL